MPKKAQVLKHAGKRIAASFSKPISRADLSLSNRPEKKLYSSPYESQLTLNICPENSSTEKDESHKGPTERLATPSVVPLTRKDTFMSNLSSDTVILDATTPYEDIETEGLVQKQHQTRSHDREPRLSWAVTLGSMVIVTIVSTSGPRHTEVFFFDDHIRL